MIRRLILSTVGAPALCLCLAAMQVAASAQGVPTQPPSVQPQPAPSVSAQPASAPALTLDAVVQQALAQNPQVTAAQQAVVAAQAGIVTARTGLLPSVSLSGTGGFGNTGGFNSVSQGTVGPGTSLTTTGSVSISGNLPLYDSGKTQAEVIQAEGAAALAEATLKQVQQDIALQAATDFFGVLKAERTTTVREALLAQAQQQLAQTQAQFRAGTSAQADVIQSQSLVAQAQVDLLAAQNQIATTKAALRSVLGLDAQGLVEVQEPPAPSPAAPTVASAAAVQEALQNRPEIAEGLADITSSQGALALAYISAGVQLNVGLSAGYVPFSTNTFATNSSSYGVTATLALPLYDSGKGKAGIDAAKANLTASQARLSQTQLAIRQDAYQAYLAVAQGAATVTATAAAQQAADEALRVAKGRYTAGVATIVEVTTSQATAAQADVNAVNALYDYQTALATLRHAVGRPIVGGSI